MAARRTAGAAVGPSGMMAFVVVWAGQAVSLLGTGMTRFALTVWAWERTGEATALALVAVFSFAPGVIISPLAGALVDRWNRKLAMMISDLAAGLSTVAVLLLYAAGTLEIWHLFVAGAFASTFEAFQFPAYSAAITLMIPRKQYARAQAMLGLANSLSGIAAPALAVVLLAAVDIRGVLLLDVLTFCVALGTLLAVHIPQPSARPAEGASRPSLWADSLFGFRYILARPSLLGLQLIFFAGNFALSLAFVLLPAMILARTGNDQAVLGTVQSAMALGGLAGGLAVTAWGGPRRRVHGVLLGFLGMSLLGEVGVGLGREVVGWTVAGFLALCFTPLIDSSNQAIWQAKIPAEMQGRVFAVRRLIAQLSVPLAGLIAGPLADAVFEPAMQPGGALAGLLGGLVGTGPGAGMAVIFLAAGLLGTVTSLGGYAVPAIREAEGRLPDHIPQEA